jgi:membrane protease YdiL (CAAX protease family)
LLGSIIWHFTDPRFFVADFLTLFAIGLALAHARLRSGSLWLPMGMHCGWVLVFKLYHALHFRLTDGPVPSLLVGADLRSGVLPLVVVALTSLACSKALSARMGKLPLMARSGRLPPFCRSLRGRRRR